MSGHLGDRVSALVDGQLSPAATERALAHVACCRRCAAELAAARAARRVLCDADDVRPAGDLTARLLALGCPPGAEPARPAARPAPRAMDPFVPPAGRRTPAPAGTGTPGALDGLLAGGRGLLGHAAEAVGDRGPLGTRGVLGSRDVLGARGVLGGGLLGARRSLPGATGGQGRRGLRAAVGSLTGLGVVAVGLFLLGDRPAVTPATGSADALAVLGDAGVAAVPVAGPAAAGPAAGASTQQYLDWMRAQGWTCPAEVPAGWAVTSVRLRDDTLEVDLSAPGGGEVVVTERQGRLDLSALTAAEPLDVDGRTVYLLSTAPWHVAWQSGDTVVEIVAEEDVAGAATVVAQFPDGEFDAGLPARLTRGWDTFTAAMHLP